MPRELAEAATTIYSADIYKTIIQQKQRRQFRVSRRYEVENNWDIDKILLSYSGDMFIQKRTSILVR